MIYEKNLSAQKTQEGKGTRIQTKNENTGRQTYTFTQKKKGQSKCGRNQAGWIVFFFTRRQFYWSKTRRQIFFCRHFWFFNVKKEKQTLQTWFLCFCLSQGQGDLGQQSKAQFRSLFRTSHWIFRGQQNWKSSHKKQDKKTASGDFVSACWAIPLGLSNRFFCKK
jgi:hypothetical protein